MSTAGTAAPQVAVVRTTWTSAIASIVLAGVLGVMVTLPWWASQGLMRDCVEFFTLLALAQMWNLLAGYAGLVSIGQQAFLGVGAYSLYMLADKGGVHPFAAAVLAGLVAAAISIPAAAVAFQLRGGYFAIATWVIAEVLGLLVLNGTDLGLDLGGGVGVTILSAARLDHDLRAHGTYWLALGAGAGVIAYLLLRSRIGLALTAIRDDEAAARSLGVDVLRTKVIVWIIAAFGCGVAGAVIYLNLVRVDPSAAFTVNWTAYMIFIVVIGGIGTIEGPIVGTIIFFVLQQELSDYGVWYLIILGSVAVLSAVWLRGGVWGEVATRLDLHLFPVQRRVRVRTGP
jgi:branched-chain amino acid transport system permease protein